MNSESVDIRITNEARIRLLASADHDHCQAMANECHGFITNLDKFKETSKKVMEALSTTLDTIEKEKMMAIGKRNAIENEYDNRKRKMNDLHMLLKEKENELQRVHDHHESLVRILSTQEKEMEKMKGF